GGEGDDRIKIIGTSDEFDAVGDHFTADEGGFHAFSTHGDTVGNADGIKFKGRSTGCTNAFLKFVGEAAQVKIAGANFRPCVGNTNQRLGEISIRQTDGFEHGTGSGTVIASDQCTAASIQLGNLVANFR